MNDTTERFLAYVAYKGHCERVKEKYPESLLEACSFAEWIDAWSWDES